MSASRSIGVVIESAPGPSLALREALDLAFAGLALDQRVSVFFLGDGVLHCLPPAASDGPDPARLIGSLPLYDPALVAVDADALAARGHGTTTLRWPFERLSTATIGDYLGAQDLLL
ncbi:MAG: DsrE family protein [Pseudomonadota bacterium]